MPASGVRLSPSVPSEHGKHSTGPTVPRETKTARKRLRQQSLPLWRYHLRILPENSLQPDLHVRRPALLKDADPSGGHGRMYLLPRPQRLDPKWQALTQGSGGITGRMGSPRRILTCLLSVGSHPFLLAPKSTSFSLFPCNTEESQSRHVAEQAGGSPYS